MRDITNDKYSIYELQRYLRELHYDTGGAIPLVNPDGIYGDETRAAVEAFRSIHGLPPGDYTDNAAWDAIYREFQAAQRRRQRPNSIFPFPEEVGYTVKRGERSDISAIIQFILRLLANTYDSIEGASPQGAFSETNVSDIMEFQRISGLPITGEVDKTTWNALANAYNITSRIQN